MVEQLANFGETTLAEALDDSETGIDVTDDVFPASGNFRLIVDDEIMLATANSYPTVTVTRGAESTTAASHSNGADIKMVVTAASLPLIVTENQTTIADDALWDAAGDLAVGSGANTAAKLVAGATGTRLQMVGSTVTWATSVGARAYNNTTQSISNATNTVATLNSEDKDTDSIHSTVSNTGRMTIPANMGGRWLFDGVIRWQANATGVRIVSLRLNGTTVIGLASDEPESASYDFTQSFSRVMDVAAGDYVEIEVYQNSGISLTIGHASVRGVQTDFGCHYLGA